MGFDGIDRNRKFVGDPGVFFFFFFFDSTQHENFQTLGRLLLHDGFDSFDFLLFFDRIFGVEEVFDKLGQFRVMFPDNGLFLQMLRARWQMQV